MTYLREEMIMKRLLDLTPSEGPSQALGTPERGGELLRVTDLPAGEVAQRDELRQAAAADVVDWAGDRCGAEHDGSGI